MSSWEWALDLRAKFYMAEIAWMAEQARESVDKILGLHWSQR